MERVSHKAMFYENNPVLAPDKEWEYTLNVLLMLLLSVMEYGMMKANKI